MRTTNARANRMTGAHVKRGFKPIAVALAIALAFMGAPVVPREALADEASPLAAAAPAASAASAVGRVGAPSAALETQASEYDTSWYDGRQSPYTVSNVKQLQGLAYLVNQGKDDFKGKVVQLPASVTSAIVFSKASIDPIGTEAHPFEGTFDGRGRVIANLSLNVAGRLAYVGLFGYAGESATIENVTLQGGAVNVANALDGRRIHDVGAIAGHLGGSLRGCRSSAAVSVTNDGAVPQAKGMTSHDLCTMLYIGGLVGSLGGDMVNCAHQSATLSVSSASDITDDVPYIAGFVGGLAGYQGDEEDAAHVTTTSGCTNTGPLSFSVTGAGGVDRFGAQIYSKSTMVGGIVGYAMGNVVACTNAAAIQTGIVKDGVVQAGWGASNVGGIVGSLRGPTVAEAASATGVVGSNSTDPGYTVWTRSEGTEEPPALSVSRCMNTAEVTGLASVAGICGSGGAFTSIVACGNTATIEGTRWNKPCPAGIAGITNGDIRYCYNQGRCLSTTGGGYYASGIAALLTTYNTSVTPDNLKLEMPEICGCYVTGIIGGSATGYRTAVIAGENDGFIHDNCFLANLTVDKVADEALFGDGQLHSRLVSENENRGVVASNHEVSAASLRASEGVAYLNAPNATRGDWSLYYVPVADKYPQLSWQAGVADADKTSLDGVVSAAYLAKRPLYSASYDPIPRITLETRNGVKLYQDADFRVIPQAGARAVTGGTPYSATIVGVNRYKGTLSAKIAYGIGKASIGECTVSATPEVFNWERRAPSKVTLRDTAGNIVDPSEYSWETLANADGDPAKVDGKYYDYINCHSADYRYDIKVTAAPDSEHYEGQTTQAAFQITWASLMCGEEGRADANRDETAKYDKVVWDGVEWDYQKALATKGYVKVKYTGEPIKPTIANPTYLGRPLRDGTGKPWYYYPLDYDYRYIYGNANPEEGSDMSAECVNVTGSDEADLACMTIRFTTGGNFDNYSNIFFEITPASIADDVAIAPLSSAYAYTGAAVTPKPVLTFNGERLVEGDDYELAYGANTAKGTGAGTVTITGKGNFAGSKTLTFDIADSIAGAVVTLPSATYAFNGRAVEPEVVVTLNGSRLAQGTHYALSYEDNDRAGTAKVIVEGRGTYAGAIEKTFTITPASIVRDVDVRSASSYAYAGGAVEPDFALTCNGAALVKDVDYTVTFENNRAITAEGAPATAKISGIGSYEGQREVSFAITRADVQTAVEVAGVQEAYPYTGAAVKPVPTLTNNGNLLVAGTDYDVAYGANVETGTGTLTVTGKGNYTGTRTVSFAIKPSIADAEVGISPSSFTFAGMAIEPKPTVRMNGATLVEGTHYALAYEGNDRAGRATLTVSGIGDYAGSREVAFDIAKADISEASAFAMTGLAEEYAYNGAPLEPKPAITFNGVELSEGVDYTLAYAGNAAAGRATITVSGTGSYEGERTAGFDVRKGNVKTDVKVSMSSTYGYRVGGVAPKPVITCDGNLLSEGVDYTLEYVSASSVGQASVVIRGMGMFEGAKTQPFSIEPGDMGQAVSVSGIDASYAFAGKAVKPAVAVSSDGVALEEGVDYEISYGPNAAVGMGTVVIAGKGNFAGSKTYLFEITGTISKAGVSGVASSYTYTGTAISPAPRVVAYGKTLKPGEDYTVSYAKNLNAGTASVTVKGSGSYVGTATVSFKIAKAKAAKFKVAKVKAQKLKKKGKAVKPAPAVKFAGKKLKKGVDYKLSYKNNKKKGTAKLIVRGKGNFTGKKVVKFKIS